MAVVLFITGALSFIAAWYILPIIILKPMRYSKEQLSRIFPLGLDPETYGMTGEEFDVSSFDGVILDGLLIQPDTITEGIVVMLHGIGSYKEVFYSMAKNLSDQGYMVMLTDLRAMGQSGGEFCTYGYYEKKDIEIITELLHMRYPNLPIALYGTSLGGAIAIQSMATNPLITAGIIECTYDEIGKVVRGYAARKAGVQLNLIADFALWRASREAGFEPDSMNPADYSRSINQPVLIAHGTQDMNIPISWGKHNFENMPSQEKIFYEIKGASHHNLSTIGGTEYSIAVLQFLKEHLCGAKN